MNKKTLYKHPVLPRTAEYIDDARRIICPTGNKLSFWNWAKGIAFEEHKIKALGFEVVGEQESNLSNSSTLEQEQETTDWIDKAHYQYLLNEKNTPKLVYNESGNYRKAIFDNMPKASIVDAQDTSMVTMSTKEYLRIKKDSEAYNNIGKVLPTGGSSREVDEKNNDKVEDMLQVVWGYITKREREQFLLGQGVYAMVELRGIIQRNFDEKPTAQAKPVEETVVSGHNDWISKLYAIRHDITGGAFRKTIQAHTTSSTPLKPNT